MVHTHVAKTGECITSIADQYGFSGPFLWSHGDNAELKKLRQDMNILQPGDIVAIPDKIQKSEQKPDGQRHRFRRKGIPAKFRLRLLNEGEPRAKMRWVLEAGTTHSEGVTDSDGVLETFIPPAVTSARLLVGPPGQEQEYQIRIGSLPPITSMTGVQIRLGNLGFDCGREDGELDDPTRDAICEFQEFIRHPDPTGALDDRTRSVLATLHEKP